VMSVFLEGREPLRSEAAFNARVEQCRAGLGLPSQDISRLVQGLLERLGRVQAALAKAMPATAADARSQLGWLAPAGFLLVTPLERLRDFPRYLQALEQRLEKAGREAPRDAQLAAAVTPLETRYRAQVKAERALLPPGEDPYRWLLEEFRVSLFAQQLKTRVPVSAKRLDDAWAERQRALTAGTAASRAPP
jgi:ATP-dependent helicase HrpA